MGKLIMRSAVIVACGLGGIVFGGNPHLPGGTGQPNRSCETTPMQPGRSISAPGSAFNPFGTAGAVYANPDSKGGISSGNTHVVAQYDVACYQQSVKGKP